MDILTLYCSLCTFLLVHHSAGLYGIYGISYPQYLNTIDIIDYSTIAHFCTYIAYDLVLYIAVYTHILTHSKHIL